LRPERFATYLAGSVFITRRGEVIMVHLRKRLWVSAVFLSIVSLSAVGHAGLSSAKDSHVTFDAAGPAGMKIEGTTSDLSVADDGENVVITVQLVNLSTGIGLRDHHMKEKYLEVPKYPTTKLTIARNALKFPHDGERAAADVPGTIQLHGQTRPISVHYEAKAAGTTYEARGSFRVNMNEFGITVPVYLGVTVKPDVDVSASFQVAEAK
jgi:polyisoprenoid-binding protein YceI